MLLCNLLVMLIVYSVFSCDQSIEIELTELGHNIDLSIVLYALKQTQDVGVVQLGHLIDLPL